MSVAARDTSLPAGRSAGGTVPNVSLGEGNTMTGGTIIGGDHISYNIHPSAERPDSTEARDALISEITTWFNLKSNSRAIHNDVKKKRIPATGNWFVNSKEYKDWKATKGAVLCATGIPGAGKTVLMSRVVDDLLPLEESVDEKICVLFVYNRYNESLPIGDILKGFILQILQRHKHLVDLVKTLYRRGRLERTNPSDEDLMNMLLRLEGHFDRIYYVVDGVDEVDRKYQFDLILALGQLQGNLIFASRPLEDLRTELKNAKYLTLLAQDEDLRLLIDDRLRRYKGLCRVLDSHQYREKVIVMIAEKAAGMFLHAALQIEALGSCFSLADIEAMLDQFPAGIEGMYAASISRIEDQGRRQAQLAKQVLFWLVFSRGTLSLRDLQAALGVNPETYSVEKSRMPDKDSIVDLCCGLVELDRESDVVRLVHFTARDALEPLLLKDFPHPHLFITKALAQRMVDNNLPRCTSVEREAFDALIKREPLLDYAYRHWGTHVLECGDAPDAVNAAMAFLRQCTSFPRVTRGDLDLLKPLHVAAYYGIRIYVDHVFGSVEDPDSRTTPHPGSQDGSPQPGAQGMEGVGINDTTIRRSTALIIASAHGHIDFARQILQIQGIDVNARDCDGETALIGASEDGGGEVVKALLQVPDIDVNTADNDGWTALMLASANGHDGVVEQLLQVPGIDVNAADNDGWTALMLASRHGHDGVVEQLLQVPGIDVNAADNDGWTALMLASRHGHDGVVKQLLQVQGIDVNAAKSDGCTALMVASANGHDGVVKQLLQVPGIDVNAATNDGWTALMLASHHGHDGVVKQLLQVPGIDVNAATNDGWTALMLASRHGHDGVVKQLLQVPGIDVNAATNDGWTALMLASQKGHGRVVKELLQVPGIDINASANNGTTALMLASKDGHDEVVKQLLQFHGIDVNASDFHKSTALTLASYAGHGDIVRQLLEHGIDANAADNDGDTSLILASAKGHQGIVAQLLGCPGTDIGAANNDGDTALSAAQANGHISIVELLTNFIRNQSTSDSTGKGAKRRLVIPPSDPGTPTKRRRS
ncbi:ankyrin repeat domain-containing protein 50 [Coprinopsis cinerea AmutBmut pab1-1]|nr:ankyrin repeat domain-containing protein 50 [Coprinopsis cinerea AmutBmut pab1-1]